MSQSENTGFDTAVASKIESKRRLISTSLGHEPCDVVLKNATYVNVFSNELCYGDIAVTDGIIVGTGEYSGAREIDVSGKIVCPGFIDAHIHLESSMVSPAEFACATVPHGTTTVITDPHEIANVMGCDGIEYMLQATDALPIDVYFMLPSCVPATPFDESAEVLTYREIDRFYSNPRVLGLAEMMNFVGVTGGDDGVLGKISASQLHHKKIDGHAPGLSGNMLNAYISAGVYSDHECSTIDDAMEKLRKGQFIMIRDGTAAKNLDALLPLLTNKYYSRCMFATDDKHPNDLSELGHIDYIVRRAIKAGTDPIIAVKVASHNAARYFLMNNKGAVAPGYLADFAIVDNLKDFNVVMTIKRGNVTYDGHRVCRFTPPKIDPELEARAKNTFNLSPVRPSDFETDRPLGRIGLIGGQIVSEDLGYADGVDISRDILKIAVIERHHNTHHIGIGYISGYGLNRGAIATSIAHDSHNIIVVGKTDRDMACAVNSIIKMRGGISVVEAEKVRESIPLPIAGLMSEKSAAATSKQLEKIKKCAFSLGVSQDIDPFMTLSFMSLPVIPTLRLTTHGVFNVTTQKYV